MIRLCHFHLISLFSDRRDNIVKRETIVLMKGELVFSIVNGLDIS